MDYELSDEVENRLDEIKKNGNSIFYVDMAVMATEELEDPLQKFTAKIIATNFIKT